ncbi:Glyoxalase/Bleomycin resistance protein/Dioxygenase superfamily protein [Streptomyces sp. 2231.1]|uniref:VOC family protein n=1 Tax=Streptomyces sp. 2231.1 TaxID=1855347 RepID=UPI00089C5775|nr:VOC family protein [Streptomyces sp. 2231.1]SEC21077.1 Glyoxalase/Bleomycin resistance protein/Dioxygenase superfamily protein [Streptomyces sp. 2231.1]
MQITSTTISLTVDDVPASAAFLVKHFGYQEAMAAEGFASLVREGAADLIFLRRGVEVLPEGFRDQHAAGVIVAFTVTDLEAEYARLRSEGAPITMPPREEPWGERLFQVTDPNGVVLQLVSWATPEHR